MPEDLRLAALAHAIEIGRNRFKNTIVDEKVILTLAEAFLAFLQGGKPQEPATTEPQT